MEALDAQVPLIASAVGGLKDFLINGKNALLFEDNNVDELLKAYADLADSRDELIAGGTATAAEYNWQSIAMRLTEIYRGLLP